MELKEYTMGLKVSYPVFERVVESLKCEYQNGNMIVFGSFALVGYADIFTGVKIDNFRDTGDVDIFSDDEKLEDKLLSNLGCGVGVTPEGSYFKRLDDFDGSVEFFMKGIFESIDPKYAAKLEDYLFDEKGTMHYQGLKLPAPWIWLGFKLAACRKGNNPKHISDVLYLRGILGDEGFNESLNMLNKNGFKELVEVYKKQIKNYG